MTESEKLRKEFKDMNSDRVSPAIMKEFLGCIDNTAITTQEILEIADKFKSLEPDKALDFLQLLVEYATLARKHLEQPAKKSFYSRDSILKMIEVLPNPSDKAIVLSLHEGLMGKDFCEIIEIRPEDITDDGIYIKSRDRVFPASKELIEFYRQAAQATLYKRLNVFQDDRYFPLYENGTALKNVEEGKAVNQIQIRYRVKRLFDLIGIDETISPKALRKYGMYDFAIRQGGPDEKGILQFIKKKFNRKLFLQFGVEAYNPTRATKEMLELGLISSRK